MYRISEFDFLAKKTSMLALWNEENISTFPLDEALLLQNLRPWEERFACFGAFVAEKGEERLVAYSVVKRGLALTSTVPFGNISLFFVGKAVRGRGIGNALLEACENWLRSLGACGVKAGEDRRHFFPGLPVDMGEISNQLEYLFASRGYRAGSLNHDLIGHSLPPFSHDENGPGEELLWSYSTPDIFESSISFFNRNFPGRWTAEYLEFVRGGFNGRDFIFILDKKTGMVQGFCRICLPESPIRQPGLYWKALFRERSGSLGPIGVDAGLRGKGFGLALLRRGLEELGSRGVGPVVIDWTHQVEFFSLLGFRVWKSYRSYVKNFS